MSIWSWLSFAALVAATAPPAYFFLHTRKSNASYAFVSLLLVVALLVHSLFHLMEALEAAQVAVLQVEAASAALLLVFSLFYWPLRRRG